MLKNSRNRRLKVRKMKKGMENAEERGITLIALIVTILFSYDEKIKSSNSKGFLLLTI